MSEKNTKNYVLSKKGRFLKCEFKLPHLTLTTSHINGGMSTLLKGFLNHQSVEGVGHDSQFDKIHGMAKKDYHTEVCAEGGCEPTTYAMMGTAANMQYAVEKTEIFEEISVTAVVTAGVKGNAARAGDPAKWDEKEGKWKEVNPLSGTINTIVLVNQPLSPAALSRAVVTMTEAKSAALEELSIGSKYSSGLATGTGTDQFCIGSVLQGEQLKTWSGHHTRLGELMGRAVKSATLEALRWQNGLEQSYTRHLFHILGRFGITEKALKLELEKRTGETAKLLQKNGESIGYDPQVACFAWSLSILLDKINYGSIPQHIGDEMITKQCALLVAGLSGNENLFLEGIQKISNSDSLIEKLTDALILGWAGKWA